VSKYLNKLCQAFPVDIHDTAVAAHSRPVSLPPPAPSRPLRLHASVLSTSTCLSLSPSPPDMLISVHEDHRPDENLTTEH
jgi:hypothetical protein